MSYYIQEAQKILKKAGLYEGSIDGEFGEGSFGAVEQLAVKAGIEIELSPSPSVPDAPAWIVEANKYIGLKEIVGRKHNPVILEWVKELDGWFTDDETPWCGTFVAICLKRASRSYPEHWYRALAYEDYGTRLAKPAYGCIGTMGRSGGGHVVFVVGETKDGKYLVGHGGNQSNAVNLMKFPKTRFTAWIWPSYGSGVLSSPYQSRYELPKYDDNLQVSTSEA